MSRRISRGKRAHLLALCGVIVAPRKSWRVKLYEGLRVIISGPAFGAHDRLIDETDAGLRARMRAHAVPPDGEWILFRPGGPTAHEKMLAHVGEQISLAILGKG